jgi:alpha-beta hydrolase superfamily lysophospholipase
VINIIHGLGEHSSRYADWAGKLAVEGYIVRSFDHRGHGRSEGRKGHGNYDKIIQDIGEFVDEGRIQYPSLPVFIYGQSLGGNFVLNYSIKTEKSPDGLIVTSPWLELSQPPSAILRRFVFIMSKVIPGILASNRIGIEDLSRDLRIVHNYKTDPLVHDRISLQMFRHCYEAGLRASRSIYKINVPLLVMHGSEDNVTSCAATRRFVQNTSSSTSYIEWEGSYHELHNDLDRDKVFNSILDWLNQYANPEPKRNA